SGTGSLLRRLVGQVTPGVVGVVVAPVRLEAAADGPAAIGSLVPGGKQAVQRVIDKDLTAVAVAVVADPPDVAVVAAVHVEIISDIENISDVSGIRVRAGRRQAACAGGHTAGLQARVVAESVGNCRRTATAANKARQSVIRIVRRRS